MIWTAPTRSVAGSAIVEVDVFNITSGEAVSEIMTVGIADRPNMRFVPINSAEQRSYGPGATLWRCVFSQ